MEGDKLYFVGPLGAVQLDYGLNLIGRTRAAEVYLRDRFCSRHQATIYWGEDGTLMFYDHSLSGSLVNGNLVKADIIDIQIGDTIQIGPTEYKLCNSVPVIVLD